MALTLTGLGAPGDQFGGAVPGGLYFYRPSGSGFDETKKLVLLK